MAFHKSSVDLMSRIVLVSSVTPPTSIAALILMVLLMEWSDSCPRAYSRLLSLCRNID